MNIGVFGFIYPYFGIIPSKPERKKEYSAIMAHITVIYGDIEYILSIQLNILGIKPYIHVIPYISH